MLEIRNYNSRLAEGNLTLCFLAMPTQRLNEKRRSQTKEVGQRRWHFDMWLLRILRSAALFRHIRSCRRRGTWNFLAEMNRLRSSLCQGHLASRRSAGRIAAFSASVRPRDRVLAAAGFPGLFAFHGLFCSLLYSQEPF